MNERFDRDVVAAVASHYDQLDRFYRDIWGTHIHHGLWQSGWASYETALANLIDLIATRARLTRGHRVCDVGCGYGATARYLAQKINTEVTGITISEAQFRVAVSMESGNSALRFIQGDWLANNFPDDYFDAVIAIESTEPMPDRPRFFSESARVLKRGGRLVVATWVIDPYLRHSHFRWLIRPLTIESWLQPLETPAQFAGMIEASGLQLEHSEEYFRAGDTYVASDRIAVSDENFPESQVFEVPLWNKPHVCDDCSKDLARIPAGRSSLLRVYCQKFLKFRPHPYPVSA